MPSRRFVALVALFWLVTTGYVVYRDVWPVFFSSGPPPVGIDLADEAAQNIATRWKVLWNGKQVGVLDSQMKYLEADDTFRFTTKYKNLRVEVAGMTVVVPELTNTIRVSRAGDLREQTAEGRLELEFGGAKVGEVRVNLEGVVTGGQLITKLDGTADLPVLGRKTLNKTLDPVPVPKGQPLNPMQPVNRIAGVRPGRRWVVHESNPLNDAVRAVASDFGVKPPEQTKRPLIGEVLSEPRDLDWNGQRVSCWVIEYRRDEVEVRTWVRVSDGKVLKQEAFQKGESLVIEREE
jgi:hypothetical protein